MSERHAGRAKPRQRSFSGARCSTTRRSAAVAMRVDGLALCDELTLIFHGRSDLSTIQTYVALGGHGTGAAIAGDELLRVPCDLDLADAADRDEARRLYRDQAGAPARRA